MMIQNKSLMDRFLRYVAVDTRSEEEAQVQPSTKKQFDLADILARELTELGAAVDYDREHCYVYASIPGSEPALGFVAHMDTSPAVSGKHVHARIIEQYQGEDAILKTEDFPELLEHFGEDLIATDGTTLLGADDKAGVAEIMNLAEYYLTHPKTPHRAIRIAFTPDEEIGEGTANFDPERFGAKEAYTVDGGKLGILEYECFNAASARVEIRGKSVHPGSAKNAMLNAALIGTEFASLMPKAETPEHTEGYEGFFMLEEMKGDVEHAVLKYIIRDHDREKLEARKVVLNRTAHFLNETYGEDIVTVAIRDQYSNMYEILKDHPELIENAKKALRSLGVEPKTEPIRGGTDGAALSFMGIPCPNLCTGGYNYHSRFEYASVQEMEKTAQMLILLAEA